LHEAGSEVFNGDESWEHKRGNCFPKELLLTTVAREYVVDGIKFEDFFDSHERAKEYIANKCKLEKFTGKSIREDSVYTGNVVAFWDKVFANCMESPIFLPWMVEDTWSNTLSHIFIF
jgi:hypothetical protein